MKNMPTGSMKYCCRSQWEFWGNLWSAAVPVVAALLHTFKLPSTILGSMLALENLHFQGKRPCPLSVWNKSRSSAHAKTEIKFSLSLAGNSFWAHSFHGGTESKIICNCVFEMGKQNYLGVSSHPFRSCFRPQSSKYVPWQECLLRQWVTFLSPLFKVTLKYAAVSIYLSNLTIRTTLGG